jgi:hypothetical protein
MHVCMHVCTIGMYLLCMRGRGAKMYERDGTRFPATRHAEQKHVIAAT